MSLAFALITTDPNLLRCELHRLRGEVRLTPEGASYNALGVGSYATEDVLLHRGPSTTPPADLTRLQYEERSPALLFHGRALPIGMSLDDNTQPFRFRRWLFAHAGELSGYRQYKQALWEELPEYLKRIVRGETDSEVTFALFLDRLRERGHLDETLDAVEPQTALVELAAAGRRLQALGDSHGGAPSTVNLIATRPELLVAVRRGPQPLYFRELQGESTCAACELTRRTPETEARVRAHERRRSVAVATHPVDPQRWTELREGEGLAAGPDAVVLRASS